MAVDPVIGKTPVVVPPTVIDTAGEQAKESPVS